MLSYRDYKAVLENGNITIYLTTDTETADVIFKNKRFIVRINQERFPTDASKIIALTHELGHIVRNDPTWFKRVLEPIEDPKEKYKHWNALILSADAHINNEEFLKRFRALKELEGFDPVDYDNLAKEVEEVPERKKGQPVPIGSKPLYEILLKNESKKQEAMEKAMEYMLSSESPSGVDVLEALTTIKKAKIGKAPGMGNVATNKKVKYTPRNIASIEALLKKVKGVRGTRRYQKTWKRPSSRIPGVLRGAAYLPREKCVVVVDTSGSISHLYDSIAGIGHELQKTHDLTFIMHHTNVYYKGPTMPEEFSSGGTMFTPAFEEAALEEPDVVVHITDTFSHDTKEAYAKVYCPIIVADSNHDFEPKEV